MCTERKHENYGTTVKSYFYNLFLIITAVLPTTEMNCCPTLYPKRPVSHRTQLTVQCTLCLFSVVFVYHNSLFELEASTIVPTGETSSVKCHSLACLFE